MKIEVTYPYMHGYLPTPRHKNLRYEEKQGKITVDIREADTQEAVLVARVRDYLNMESREINPQVQELRKYKGKWYRPVLSYKDKRNLMPKDELIADIGRVYLDYDNASKGNERESMRNKIRNNASKYLIVKGVIYRQTYEPAWGVTTFGLGNNHGGTGLFITNPSRISKGFNLADKDLAIKEAYEVAMRRGDTESAKRFKIETFNTYDAVVLQPGYLTKYKR